MAASALLQYRKKKWRKLSKTLLSDLTWVQAKGFRLQKDVEPRFFVILPVLGILFLQCPFSVFKEINS